MPSIRSMVKRAGGRFYTENLMSNPVQVRESVTMTVDQLDAFVRDVIEECLLSVEAPSTDFDRKYVQAKTNFGVL